MVTTAINSAVRTSPQTPNSSDSVKPKPKSTIPGFMTGLSQAFQCSPEIKTDLKIAAVAIGTLLLGATGCYLWPRLNDNANYEMVKANVPSNCRDAFTPAARIYDDGLRNEAAAHIATHCEDYRFDAFQLMSDDEIRETQSVKIFQSFIEQEMASGSCPKAFQAFKSFFNRDYGERIYAGHTKPQISRHDEYKKQLHTHCFLTPALQRDFDKLRVDADHLEDLGYSLKRAVTLYNQAKEQGMEAEAWPELKTLFPLVYERTRFEAAEKELKGLSASDQFNKIQAVSEIEIKDRLLWSLLCQLRNGCKQNKASAEQKCSQEMEKKITGAMSANLQAFAKTDIGIELTKSWEVNQNSRKIMEILNVYPNAIEAFVKGDFKGVFEALKQAELSDKRLIYWAIKKTVNLPSNLIEEFFSMLTVWDQKPIMNKWIEQKEFNKVLHLLGQVTYSHERTEIVMSLYHAVPDEMKKVVEEKYARDMAQYYKRDNTERTKNEAEAERLRQEYLGGESWKIISAYP